MHLHNIRTFALVTAVGLLVAPGAMSAQPSVIKVTLFDQGAGTPMSTGLGMAMPGADMKKASMHVAALPTFAKAGDVTFQVTNVSKDTIHEMLVVKIPDTKTALPFDPSLNKVIEDKAGSLGEVSELDPGKTGTVTLKLSPGKYVLFCDQPGHYMAGMWTTIDVK